MSIETLVRRGAMDVGVISIGGGLPAPELFPRKQLATAFLQAMREPACPALQYDWPEGQNDLRHWVAQRLRSRGAQVRPADVVITAGAQQGLALAAQLLLPVGARVRVATETYPAALDLFRRRGVTPVTDDGKADCIYFVDGITNPRGLSPAAALRRELSFSPIPIIADEAYAELAFSGRLSRPLIADARDEVWHVGTLSKTICPGLRIGWLVPPRKMVHRVIELKQTTDLQTASISQVVIEKFLAHDDYEARLQRARTFYERRAHALVRALRRQLPDWRFRDPEGGFSVFAEADPWGDEEDWLRTALAHGVSFDPGSLFRTPRTTRPLGMRLCFSATKSTQLVEAVGRLARAWHTYQNLSAKSHSLVH